MNTETVSTRTPAYKSTGPLSKVQSVLVLIQLLLLIPLSASAQRKLQQTEAVPPLIPVKDFFRNPDKVAYQLSPNGEYLASL
ncbi:MAG TPA: hypothetical protein VIR01_05805, partial [Pyrinomonadaceae bacterium]